MSMPPRVDCMTFMVVSGVRKTTGSVSFARASSGASVSSSLGPVSTCIASSCCAPSAGAVVPSSPSAVELLLPSSLQRSGAGPLDLAWAPPAAHSLPSSGACACPLDSPVASFVPSSLGAPFVATSSLGFSSVDFISASGPGSAWSTSAAELLTRSLRSQSWLAGAERRVSKSLPSSSRTSKRQGRLPWTSSHLFCWMSTFLLASSGDAYCELTCHHPGEPWVCISLKVTTRASRPLAAALMKTGGWSGGSLSPTAASASTKSFSCPTGND
mmetsp:Transcript_128233/g.356916  ORF Transcript_128233/g.356916 Transcript_128233/m.356916 type:complete len:271 (+) Transcript_128233:77-889(+)